MPLRAAEREETAMTDSRRTREAQHTPGPWKDRIATGVPDHMISGAGEGVCVIPFKYGEGAGTARRNANARLIAAAPDLHESLVAIISAYDKWVRDEIADEDFILAVGDEAHRAHAAIAKARGMNAPASEPASGEASR